MLGGEKSDGVFEPFERNFSQEHETVSSRGETAHASYKRHAVRFRHNDKIPQASSMDVCLLAYMLRTRLQIVFATNVDSYKEDARLRHCLRAVSCIMN